MLNIDNKISLLPIGVTQVNLSVNVHLHNSNKHRLILAKFHVNNAAFIMNQIQLNPLRQTIAKAAFVRSPQNS